MRTRATARGLLSLMLTIVGCGEDTPNRTTAPSVDCSKVTVPKWSELPFSFCIPCHSSSVTGPARKNAPAGTNFDTAASTKPFAAGIATRVHAGQMPPAGQPQPSQAQKDALIAWASCGTPE